MLELIYSELYRPNLVILIKKIMNINSFWISTAPRTGSMWLYNVTREILKFSKKNVLPIKTPKFDTQFEEIYEKQSIGDQINSNNYVFKVHKVLTHDLQRSKILTTIRDPRDICLSFKKFMKTDFDHALKAAKSILKFEKIYKTYHSDYLKFFRYNNIENLSIETILEVANFIGYKIDYKNAQEISLKFSKNKIKNLIKNNDENLLSMIKNKEEIDKSKIVYFSKDNYRSFDIETGFQTNHISSHNSGDWKKFFSSKEIEILNYEFQDFISEYKF